GGTAVGGMAVGSTAVSVTLTAGVGVTFSCGAFAPLPWQPTSSHSTAAHASQYLTIV
ncbi:MAG: hypothetical protein IAE79_20375, partial [Anaerolinea sp.]|nr:hypothetical protein [Anaerolinea sp.]